MISKQSLIFFKSGPRALLVVPADFDSFSNSALDFAVRLSFFKLLSVSIGDGVEVFRRSLESDSLKVVRPFN